MNPESEKLIQKAIDGHYPAGFTSDIPADVARRGLTEETVRFISKKKKEPRWLLTWRLKAFSHWQQMPEPTWGPKAYQPLDYQNMHYYAAPKNHEKYKSLDEVDPEILATFERLGVPLEERKRLAGVAVDAVLDSVSVATVFKEELAKQGIIFCSFSEAVQQHPTLVKKYLGRVVPYHDNKFAALNAAVFSDGSFCYIPAGVRCPMELSTYFRINAANTGQFERTLIIAEPGSYVSYLEGCTAPMRSSHQLHAAVVEINVGADAEVRYATIQNWYPGDETGKGGVYNCVTKRGLCDVRGKLSWVQFETGSAITWKYPSCILKGDHSVGDFYSVAITKGCQEADTGTKMIHLGQHTRSRIISKSIAASKSKSTYRGLVKMMQRAAHAYNFSQCDALMIGPSCSSHTIPYLETNNKTAQVQHEATTSKVDEAQLFYLQQRGLTEEAAHELIVLGFCKEVLDRLPMEFAMEARKLLTMTLEGTVG